MEKIKEVKEYILKENFATTNELSERFGVSQQTIRKYLKKLEEIGSINRVHGGAESKSTFNDRLSIDIEAKQELSKACAALIKDQDTIYIDSGTTYFHIVDYLPKDIEVSIVTNSIPMAMRIREISHHKVLLVGGYIDDITFGTYSSDNFSQISSIIFDKAFFGTSGFSLDYEFTEDNFNFLDFQKEIKKNTKQSIIAAGAIKEGKVSSQKSFAFSELDIFITEKSISSEMKEKLNKELSLVLI